MRRRAEEFEEREDQAKAKVNEAVRRANSRKQTLLTAELLRKIEYGDMDVAHRILTGFPLVGTMTEVATFEQRQPDDVLTGADTIWLARTASASRADLIQQVVNTTTDEVFRDIYKTTTDKESGEVKKGWADGPYTENQIHDIVGDKLWIAARRFGVTQKEKVRQIDDFSEYFLNACTTVADKIPVAGIDAIANHVKFWADKLLEARRHPEHVVTATLSTGEKIQGQVHPDYLGRDAKPGTVSSR